MENHGAESGPLPGDVDPAPNVPPSLGPMRYLHSTVEALAIALFLAIVTVAVAQVVNRFFLGQSLSWSEEFQRYGHIWLVFMAVSIAYRRSAHIGVDVFQQMMPSPVGHALRIAIDIAWLVLGVFLILSVSKLLGISSRQISAGLGITMNKVYFGFVLGGAYMMICAVEQLILRVMGRMPK
ncbi:TRAP transporter small permease [Cohaesibacter celericrescens]|uniref:TRAP transporter small permease protein n=1 Tax=Cohaesibacter celericrescens TaxID=2067669 RepID=A0A2N5XLX0_9HYPH|nr:TRAP transporter small permease [Cohaesibacter celericrescens]PLW75428.1 hypothetical protein C0081_20390 [Cohaesibacter celericrescens]